MFDPPSWQRRPEKKSRSDRILGSILALAVLLVGAVLAAKFLHDSGGLGNLLMPR
jgi:hypothetical protein